VIAERRWFLHGRQPPASADRIRTESLCLESRAGIADEPVAVEVGGEGWLQPIAAMSSLNDGNRTASAVSS
jgi:hypothetical protein